MAAALPINYFELVDMLNNIPIPEFTSPPPGPLQFLGGTPYNSLGKGTRLLISIADSMHDLKKVKTIPGVLRPSGPGQATLKAWGRNLILRLAMGVPAVQAALAPPAVPGGFVDRMLDIIYTAPENFVHYYLYYNDMFYYTNYQYISEPSPLTVPGVPVQVQNRNGHGHNVTPYHFLLLNYPPHGNSGKSQTSSQQSVTAGANYSKLSASILYKIYEKLFAESNWDMTSGVPPDVEGTQYSPVIQGTDGNLYRSIWYSCDQGAANKIFHQYDCQKSVPQPHFDGLTNWYMWIGYAAQYDRTDLISASEASKLYCMKNIPATCNFSGHPGYNLQVTLAPNESMLGINDILLDETEFIWSNRNAAQYRVNYDLPMRANMKSYLQNALGYVDDQGQQNAPNLWAQIFACKQGFAAMIDELCPGFCIKTGAGLILGLNFANGSALSNSFPTGLNQNSGITYDPAYRRYDALSLFTDFKRIGDYLQAKEIYALNFLSESPMPLLTHDGILATISHKIFNNHTVWFKRAKINRSATYIVMLPLNNVSLRINKTANPNSKLPNAAGADAAHPEMLLSMANAIQIETFITNIMGDYPGDYTQRMWGGSEGGGKRGGMGRGSFAVHFHPFGPPPKKKGKNVQQAEQQAKQQAEQMRTYTGKSVARSEASVARAEESVPQACLLWMSSVNKKIKSYYPDGKWEESLRVFFQQPEFHALVNTYLLKANIPIKFEPLSVRENEQLLEFFIAYIKILLWEINGNGVEDEYAVGGDIMGNNNNASAAIVHMHYLYTLMDEDLDNVDMGYVYKDNDIYDDVDGMNKEERRKVKNKSGKKKVPPNVPELSKEEKDSVFQDHQFGKQLLYEIENRLAALASEHNLEVFQDHQLGKQLLYEIENRLAALASEHNLSLEYLEKARFFLSQSANAAEQEANYYRGLGQNVNVGEAGIEKIKTVVIPLQFGGKGCSLVGKYNVTESKKTKIYLDNITKLKETNNVLKKNKIKNKNKIEKNNKQINELKEKIKKEKLKEKEKVKKQKLKEKLKKAKLKEKEKEKLKKEKEKVKKQKLKEKVKKQKLKEKLRKNKFLNE